MGYYTKYSFSILTADVHWKKADEIEKEIIKESGYDNCFSYEVKWYNWKEVIKKVSKKYPDIIIVIDGAGEDFGDFWKCYFLNGKSQMCMGSLTYEPFHKNNFK